MAPACSSGTRGAMTRGLPEFEASLDYTVIFEASLDYTVIFEASLHYTVIFEVSLD